MGALDPFPSATGPRHVLIFRSTLLAYSETFIPAQAEKFRRFTPYYAGFKALKGVVLPPERTLAPHPRRSVGRLRNLASEFGRYDSAFLSEVARVRPAVIHAHFEECGVRALPLARHFRAPLFVTCHGYDVTVEATRWQNLPLLGAHFLRRRAAMFREASRCLGVSRFICDAMLRRGYPADKMRLHYIGIDTARFSPDPAIAQKPQILFVGRLVEKKGCGDLVHAMAAVNARFPEVELVIAGSGPLRAELESIVREQRLNVRFAGVVSQDEVLRLLRESMMASMPSVRSGTGDSEGLGMVNLEAQAVGIPVVATRHGGIPEAVEDGVTGLLADERDPDGLARHILTLLDDTALRQKMGQAARVRVLRDFNLETQSQLLEDHYLEFL